VRGRPPATFTRRCEVSQLAAVMKLGWFPPHLFLRAPEELRKDPEYRALGDVRKWSKHPAVELYGAQVGRMADPDHWMIFIPHWILLLAATLPWFALLFWRARRRK